MLRFALLSVPVAVAGYILAFFVLDQIGETSAMGGRGLGLEIGSAFLLLVGLGLVLRVWHRYWVFNIYPLLICLTALVLAFFLLVGLLLVLVSSWGDSGP